MLDFSLKHFYLYVDRSRQTIHSQSSRAKGLPSIKKRRNFLLKLCRQLTPLKPAIPLAIPHQIILAMTLKAPVLLLVIADNKTAPKMHELLADKQWAMTPNQSSYYTEMAGLLIYCTQCKFLSIII
jgi:hypothetical protein